VCLCGFIFGKMTTVKTLMIYLASLSMLFGAADTEALWKKVETHQQNDAPKSAIETLRKIEGISREKKRWPECTRATALRWIAESAISPDESSLALLRLADREMPKMNREMKPVMQVLRSLWLWNYYQQNQWRFRQRTAAAATDDMATWDLQRVIQEVDQGFQQALSQAKEWQKKPASDFDGLYEKGNIGDDLRPTCYDLLAHEALAFYAEKQNQEVEAEEVFSFDETSPAYGDMKGFLAWKPTTGQASDPLRRAIVLYQKLMRFHESNVDARLHLEFERYQWAIAHVASSDTKEIAETSLRRLLQISEGRDQNALAHAMLAEWLVSEKRLPEALELARAGMKLGKQKLYQDRCRQVERDILAPSISLRTEKVWNRAMPELSIDHNNVRRVWFRLYAQSWQAAYQVQRVGDDGLWRKEKPLHEWSVELPANDDYQPRHTSISAPIDLKKGHYTVIASADELFKKDNNALHRADITVTDLAKIAAQGSSRCRGLVLHAITGEPIKAAKVERWSWEQSQWKLVQETQTDANGAYEFPLIQQGNFIERVVVGDDQVVTPSTWNHPRSPQPAQQVVHLFTDRAIYRPGQIVRFKGIAATYDREKNDYHVDPDRDHTIILRDLNGQEIAKQTRRSNRFGSFEGSFPIPVGKALGMMQLECSGNGIAFSVEEYKRPQFYVEIDPPQQAPSLGDKVTVNAKAIAYSGAIVSEAKVKWSVKRRSQAPPWARWCGWFLPMPREEKQIAHGTAVTNEKGEVEISFMASPDEKIAPSEEPIFDFVVNVDITDTGGESRHAERSVRLGYVGISANMTADSWQDAAGVAKIELQTQSIDGVGQSVDGVVKIHRLKEPDQVQRAPLASEYDRPWIRGEKSHNETPDLSDPRNWELGELVQQIDFRTNEKGEGAVESKLSAGEYRAILETKDAAGQKVQAFLPLRVVDLAAKKFAIKIPYHLEAKSWSVEPGTEWLAIWGTGYEQGVFYYEIEHRGKILQSGWSYGSSTQQMLRFAVKDEHRGGLAFRAIFQQQNRTYLTTKLIDVPWSQKDLTLRWQSMRDRTKPGSEETWTLQIEGAKANDVELLATLYDASLDAYRAHDWSQQPNQFFYRELGLHGWALANSMLGFFPLTSFTLSPIDSFDIRYRHLPEALLPQWLQDPFAYSDAGGGGGRPLLMRKGLAVPAAAMAMSEDGGVADAMNAGVADPLGAAEPEAARVEQVAPSVRKNFQETAYFAPQLTTDAQGVVTMSFTMPEALTQWRFMGFAHDALLRSGRMEGKTTTSKDLMIQANPPRFLREGDRLEFTAKVSNLTERDMAATVSLQWQDAVSLDEIDAAMKLQAREQSVTIPARSSKTVVWSFEVPDGQGPVQYTTMVKTEQASDGEQGMIPVLSRRRLVTESMTMPLRDAGTRRFEMKRLLESGKSNTLRHETAKLQIVSNPAWYAVMALPYLMEYPHECAEQTMNRYYANALARHIVQSDAKIQRVFEIWRNQQGVLDSPLLKNQELKALMIEETPWLVDGLEESQSRRRVAELFEQNRLDQEQQRARQRLQEMQLPSGAWPWFPGGEGSSFITLYLITAEARLRHLGVASDVTLSLRALEWLDEQFFQQYQRIDKSMREKNHLDATVALYLYGRSFYLKERPVAEKHREAWDYYVAQAVRYGNQLSGWMSRCHAAVALHRLQQPQAAQLIVNSLRENALESEEMGMHWRSDSLTRWHEAPIETQAMIIETFREVANDVKAVDACQVWLLKQKQTQAWSTSKSTADAIYALLLGGKTNRLASDSIVTAEWGGEQVKPEKVEVGTGFYEVTRVRSEIQPRLGEVVLKKSDAGVSWASLHWQYLEDRSQVTASDQLPLSIRKSLFRKNMTAAGAKLEAVKGALQPGDEVVSRIVIRVDRDIEYVHLKNERASGFEPVNVISSYKHQDGLGYYEMTKDSADHFFIEYLPRGTYVFETSARVQLRGAYPSGLAEIECMYAPEFRSHSASQMMEVK